MNFIKTLTTTLAAIAISTSSVNAQTNDIQRQSNGVILSFDNAGHGLLQDSDSGNIYEFERPGANVSFVIGDSVTYILIDRPKGKPPIVIDIKKPS